MNGELANKIFMLVCKGKTFEQSGLEESARELFDKITEEIKSAPKGTMMTPVNEWVGDEYDGIIEAFERVEKRGYKSKNDESYQVIFSGSSLLGKSNGIKNFKTAYTKISDLRDRGRIKCYRRWCKACTLYRLPLESDLTGHFLKISFPNVIALANLITIDWSWERPDSEWAKSTGDPDSAYKTLVERKSRPVFYVRLESEDYVNMLLGGQG
jgi:hypothetical protein